MVDGEGKERPTVFNTLRRKQWKGFSTDRKISAPEGSGFDPREEKFSFLDYPRVSRVRTDLGGHRSPTEGVGGHRSPTEGVAGRAAPRLDGSTEENSDSDVIEFVPEYGQVVPALRSKLAEQGCPKSQVYLARQLLIQAASRAIDLDEEQIRKIEEKAVFWLLKAAHQGIQEARDLLSNLHEEGRGVTDVNYPDIAAVLSLPQKMQTSRDLGSKLFNSISKGYDYVTPAQLARISQEEGCERYEQLPGKVTYVGQHGKVSREDLVHAASQYLQGDVPDLEVKISEFRKETTWRRSWTAYLTILSVILMNLYMFTFLHQQLSWQFYLVQLMVLLCSLSRVEETRELQSWSRMLQVEDWRRETVEQIHLQKVQLHRVAAFVFLASFVTVEDGPHKILIFIGFTISLLQVASEKKLRPLISLSLFSVVLWTKEDVLRNLADFQPDYFPDTEVMTTLMILGTSMLMVKTSRTSVVICSVWTTLVMSFYTNIGPLDRSVLTYTILLHTLASSLLLKKSRILVSSFVCLRLLLSLSSVETSREVSSLSWSEYQTSCAQQSSVSTAAVCAHFTGLIVQWTGVVESVQIQAVQNIPQAMISYLPQVVVTNVPVVCWFGDLYLNCDSKPLEASRTLCRHKSKSKNVNDRCHLEKYSRYTYLVKLTMEQKQLFGSSRPLELVLSNRFSKMVRKLEVGSSVQFTGALVNGGPHQQHRVQVHHLH